MFVIEQPVSLAPSANSTAQVLAQWNTVYDAHNEEEGKSVSSYALKMKGYVEQLECLSYVLSQHISVGLILNGLTSDFAGIYEKGLPKKAATPQVMTIQGGRIQKANKKSLNAKGKGKGKGKGKDKIYIPKPKNPKPSAKEHPTKDDTCHHCKKVGHCKRNCPAYLAEFIKKKKQVGTASSSDIFVIKLFSFPTKSWCMTLVVNSVGAVELGEIQNEDTPPSENTSEIPMEVEELNKHSLRDLNEPTNYKAVMLDTESNKWLDVMNAEMQSIKDNQVWHLVDLPPN
ncbi:retrotransposon protein, putative, ty1-copia subclass, partial [Tanacetum coccineum]